MPNKRPLRLAYRLPRAPYGNSKPSSWGGGGAGALDLGGANSCAQGIRWSEVGGRPVLRPSPRPARSGGEVKGFHAAMVCRAAEMASRMVPVRRGEGGSRGNQKSILEHH